MSLFSELQRRNVFRVGIAYLITAWLVAQIADLVLDNFGAPVWFIKSLLVLLAVGFPIALIIAWIYELTPDGIKRDHEVDRTHSITKSTGKRLNYVIIGLMALAIAYLLYDRQSNITTPPGNTSTAAPEHPAADKTAQASVAVLPFVSMSSGEDDEYFADGLTEEILNSLTALPELLVTARTSSFHFKGKDVPIPEIAQILGVDHVVEGSVRRAGNRLRITAQLIRASDGFHIWSETYDRTVDDTFTVQEDIAGNIAMSLDVVLDDNKKERMRSAGIKDVETFILYQKGIEAFENAHRQANPTGYLHRANSFFDAAISRSTMPMDVYLFSADLFGHILFDYATGRDRSVTREQAQEALTALRQRLADAVTAAKTPAQRSMAGAEAALFSGNWTNMGKRLDEAIGHESCVATNWSAQVASPFGRAEALARYEKILTRCDPMNEVARFSLPFNELWAGNLDKALADSEASLEKIGFHPWVDGVRFVTLAAMGRFRDDPDSAGDNPPGSWELIPRRIIVQASNGELEKARVAAGDWSRAQDIDDLSRVLVAAMLGEREQANSVAGTIDARLAGPFALSITVFECHCGAPFDLEATPRFKARIEEAGFPWPPPKRIHYPAKHW